MKRNELALAHLTISDARPLELIEAAKQGGFDSIGLCLSPSKAGQIFFPVVGNQREVNAIKAKLGDDGIRILDIEAIWLTAETSPDQFAGMLETGAELGARYALVIGNDPDKQRLKDNYATLCRNVEPLKIRMMLEFLPYLTVNTIEAAKEIIAYASSSSAGLMVDSLHLMRSGASPADIGGIDPSLLGYCQICDAPITAPPFEELRLEAREGRDYPGLGELPLTDFVKALPEGMPLSLEAPSARHASLSIIERAKLAGDAVRHMVRQSQTERL